MNKNQVFKRGLLYEAYRRWEDDIPISDAESNVSTMGNSGIARDELVKDEYFTKEKLDDSEKLYYIPTKKCILFVRNTSIKDFQDECAEEIIGDE